ncbi:VPS10 domain-containing protein [Tahibacter amnicola]|uniref:Sortilin N-terminal domain-containing protein n=1 Tax=Tahibacter amnicola TaxID=2976241 RepID=A0ABY6BBU0_9GAMM|nr:hypothetical protein [Tahibacter amnicola]UXI67277.1 hypothetical protein N4264_21440 [Tahibacter amnicola]
MRLRPSRRVFDASLMFAATLLVALPALASEPLVPDSPLLLDREEGEEWAIERRREWFRERRGLDRMSNAGALRAQAVDEQRLIMAEQESAAVPPLLRANVTEIWTALGPGPSTMLDWTMGKVSGRVTTLAVHPTDENRLFLGTAAGGLWRTTDGGQNWQSVSDNFGTQSIGSVMIDRANPNRVWVGTGDPDAGGCSDYFGLGLFLSENAGSSFAPRNGSGASTLQLSFIASLARHPTDGNLLLAGGRGLCNADGSQGAGGVFRSTDGGQTWNRVLTGNDVQDIAFDTTGNGNTVYAAVNDDGIYKSTDGGATWTRRSSGLPGGDEAGVVRLSLMDSSPWIMYALAGVAGGNGAVGLYRSSNAADSWTLLNDDVCEGQCWYNLDVDAHPADWTRALIGSIRAAETKNSGSTVTMLTNSWGGSQQVHQDTHVVLYSRQQPDRFWIGSDGGLWRTDNGGASFVNLNNGLQATQFYDIAIEPRNPNRVYGGAQDNSSQVRKNSNEWNVTSVTGDGFTNVVDPGNPNIVFQTSYPSNGGPTVLRSSQRGEPGTNAWLPKTGFGSGENNPWVTPMAITRGTVFLGSNYLYRADTAQSSGSFTWTKISGDLTGDGWSAISSIALSAANRSGVVAGMVGTANGRLFRSSDVLRASPSWSEVSANYPGQAVNDLEIDPTNDQRAYVVSSNFTGTKLYRTENAGGSWQAIGTGLPGVPANSVAIDPIKPSRIFVGTDIGVYQSNDSGANFTPFNSGLPTGMVILDLEISRQPHVLVAGTYSRGAWRTPLSDDVIFANDLEIVLP